MKTILAAAILVLVAAPSLAGRQDRNVARGEAQLQKLLKGATPGKPTSCQPYVRMESQTIEGVGILYGRGRRTYLMRFQGGCPALGQNQIVVTSTPMDRLCRGDIARIVERYNPITSGSCIVGDFTPYDRPPRR